MSIDEAFLCIYEDDRVQYRPTCVLQYSILSSLLYNCKVL